MIRTLRNEKDVGLPVQRGHDQMAQQIFGACALDINLECVVDGDFGHYDLVASRVLLLLSTSCSFIHL